MSKAAPIVLCDYCGVEARLVPDTEVYRQSYGGKVYWCRGCDAWVGTHGGGVTPLGRLADKQLRRAKIDAHAAFDPLWRSAMRHRGWAKGKARAMAYKWLAGAMGVEPRECHIGMFDLEQCQRVVEICRQYHPRKREA